MSRIHSSKHPESSNKQPQSLFLALFEGGEVRRVDHEGETYLVVIDVIRLLTDGEDPAQFWDDLKRREPALANLGDTVDVPLTGDPDASEPLEVVSVQGLFRLAQAIPSAKAEKIKVWLARGGRQRLEEIENPELALLRLRKDYERKGYDRRWVDKRLRGMAARAELTGEWYRRGATESDDFRALTNALMAKAFGMDVEAYRRYKNLNRPGQNLRDAMTDLELVLTMLAETTATVLHRTRNSHGIEALLADAQDAGEIAAKTAREIERRSGRVVVTPAHVDPGVRGAA